MTKGEVQDAILSDAGAPAESPGLRLDKWLWYARFFKSRSLATKLCNGGKLRLGGEPVSKAHHKVRPGDVLTSRSGKTVEIDNTDAEGRLVLCDALSEAVTENPELLIDMATLTGAARVAMGPDVPAIFGNQAQSAFVLLPISRDLNDPVWPLPLHQPYKRWLNSSIADMSNCSTTPLGGAITAGLFLQAFVPDSIDWLHMDVMAFNNEALPGRPKGGEAMGLRSFFAYIQQRFGSA